jgi:hypothetical protein
MRKISSMHHLPFELIQDLPRTILVREPAPLHHSPCYVENIVIVIARPLGGRGNLDFASFEIASLRSQ